MQIPKEAIPVKFDVPGATARQLTDFGDASGYSAISAEYFSLGAGTDIAPLLQGLEGDTCDSPHWGYLISGGLVVSYADATEETVTGGELFHWPPGHSVRVTDDAEVVMFSPQIEHTRVLDHMLAKMGV